MSTPAFNTQKDPRDILLSPVVSEKSYALLDQGKYTFVVDPRSNKSEIKRAVESVFGVIYPPQVALAGFGRVVEQPFAEGGLLGVRPAVVATLSADHRVSDGLRGGRFLDRIAELLQQPEEL